MVVAGSTGYAVIGTHLVLDFLALLLILQYHCRRNYQPIRSRLYWQAEIVSVLLLSTMFYAACATEFEQLMSCEAYLVLFLLVLNAMVPIIIRAAHVYSVYEVSKIYAQGESSSKEEAMLATGSVFLRRAEFLQSFRAQAALFFALCTIHLLVWLMYTQLFQPICNGLDELLGLAVVSSGYCLLTLYLGWNLATLKDGLYIRRELVLVSLGGVCALPFYVGLRFAFNSYYYANLVIAFAPYWVVGVMIGMPLYKSYVWQRLRKSSAMEEPSTQLSASNAKTGDMDSAQGKGTADRAPRKAKKRLHFRGPPELMSLLDNQEGNLLFLEFARLELNHENVLFYNDVTDFLEDHASNPELKNTESFEAMCWKIFNRYISTEAKLEVNIGAKERRTFDTAGFAIDGGHLDPEATLKAFGTAWNEVVNLMYKDVYPRFIRTRAYHEFSAIRELQKV